MCNEDMKGEKGKAVPKKLETIVNIVMVFLYYLYMCEAYVCMDKSKLSRS